MLTPGWTKRLFLWPLFPQIWSTGIKLVLKKMGKLAFNLLRRNSSVFFEEDMMECDLNFLEATVFSGMCTELPTASSRGQRKFCYVYFTLQVKQRHLSNGIHDTVVGPGLSNITCVTWRVLSSRSSWLLCTSSQCFVQSQRMFWTLDRCTFLTFSHPKLRQHRY